MAAAKTKIAQLFEDASKAPMEESCEIGGKTWTFRGYESFENVLSPVTPPGDDENAACRLWNAWFAQQGYSCTIDAKTVWKVRMVHRCYVPDEGEDRPDAVMFALLAATRGKDFASMFVAAAKVAGIMDNDALERAALGNSPGSTDGG